MDAPRLLVLVFILLILFASPDTQTPSPSQRLEINHLVGQERHALALLAKSHYGDFNAAENQWINVTGLRKQDGYAWDLLPQVQERARQHASIIITAWDTANQGGQDVGGVDNPEPTNVTLSQPKGGKSPPIYQNVTGIVHGLWIKSKLTKNSMAPILNLTTLAPRVAYHTDTYTRNVTGLEGDIRIRLDEKKSQLLDSEGVSVREIAAELTLENDSSNGPSWDMTLHGVHFPQQGSIVLATTSQRFPGIFTLPHFTLSEKLYAPAQRILNLTLAATIEKQETASETNALNPWSSSPQSTSDLFMSTPHCEYIVYLQQYPIHSHPTDVGAIETELRDPTGRLDIQSPPMKMSAVIFSPDCGFVLESKGPPDFAPQHGQHLQGPKIETYISSGRRAILVFAVIICAEISLLIRQMREASTPSTRSRISFYTIGMMAMGDGFFCMSFLVISIILDAAFLPLVTTAFLSFLSVSFFGMKFLMDIWTVQGPERDERRRRQGHDASSNTTPTAAAPIANTIITPAGADTLTLPLPVTASRSASSNGPPLVTQPTQDTGAGNQTPTDTQPPATTTPGNAARRELSALYTRFYLILLVFLFLTLYSTTWPPFLRTVYVRLLSLVYLSFYMPQIYRNIMRNCRKALQWRFVVGQSILRILPIAYLYLYPDNVLFVVKDSNWMIAVICWTWFQVWILISQELFGPRFFVPKACSSWIPAGYDYHPVLKEEDEETGASYPIGFTQITASSPSTTATTSSNGPKIKIAEGRRKGKKTFDCAICMQTLEVPIVPRDSEGASSSAATAGIGIGVKDLVFGRRVYMVTPCKHIFHSVCLEGWMRYRLQCPICRDNLPPL